jgi:hypothetical protein
MVNKFFHKNAKRNSKNTNGIQNTDKMCDAQALRTTLGKQKSLLRGDEKGAL